MTTDIRLSYPLGMRLPAYEPMAPILPEGESGNARLKHVTVTAKDEEHAKLRFMITRSPYELIEKGTYAHLLVNGRMMMSDTRTEQNDNREFLRAAAQAGGDVLIAGLGLGMILVPLLKMDNIRSVMVVEKSQGVMDLVAPPLMTYLATDRLSITQGDIFEWRPPRDRPKWDVIYFDIWADVCVDNLQYITKLKRKFARALNRDNPHAWMGAWVEKQLRSLKRRGRWR